jgi:hypothetical protein
LLFIFQDVLNKSPELMAVHNRAVYVQSKHSFQFQEQAALKKLNIARLGTNRDAICRASFELKQIRSKIVDKQV